MVEESHNHLFFACSFTRPIWISLQLKCRFHAIPSSWNGFTRWALRRWASKNLKNSVNKLMLSTSINRIWQERNNKIFRSKKCSQMMIFRQITNMIRQKLLSTSVKDSNIARRLKRDWDLPSFISPPPEPPDLPF
ncbi:uncharacterized protein LOC132309244 [Cornus florida]|uniref:uncharacterized protein LOC132309244 n=1 Tax=Cornus florida TaxID=4283 RepID=UPI0028A04448|nr:uncharacterized protein LOC132309244 [Cornus florida]